jgi:hypothetical protein
VIRENCRSLIRDEVRAVEVFSDANLHAHDAVRPWVEETSAKTATIAHIQIENAVLEGKDARVHSCPDRSARPRAVEFILYGRESFVRIGSGGLLRLGQRCSR